MANQATTSVNYGNSSTRDELMITYGEIQGSIVAGFISQQFKNTNYAETPVRGGTVKVKRFKSSTSQSYGTARAALAANKIQNNGVDVKIDTDKEIAEEMSKKDMELYMDGANTLLQSRQSDFVLQMGVTLENAYFLELQTAATTFDSSPYTGIVDRLTALIEALEGITNDHVQKVDRSLMVITLAPKHFDALDKEMQTLPNPLNGGANARYFRRVRIEPAVRQTVDAVIQVVGAVAQPVVMGEFEVEKAPFSADNYSFLPYFFGTKAIMPDLILKCALGTDNNISV